MQVHSVTNKLGTTYSASGTNITPSVTSGDTTTAGAIGGLNTNGCLTAGLPAMIQTDKAVTTSGSAFSLYGIGYYMGDATPISRYTIVRHSSITSSWWTDHNRMQVVH